MKVGIVGAGISGVLAGAHLKAAGIDVTIFERSAEAGGVWLYDERLPPEPEYPSTSPSSADFKDVEDHQMAKGRSGQSCQAAHYKDIKHAPPGPAYEGLANNVSTRLMKVTLNSWPSDTADYVNHRVINAYIQDTSRKMGIHARTVYDTRVETVQKNDGVWNVQTSSLMRDDKGVHHKIVKRQWTFDAVVVASGHYHACRIPDIPGLETWKKRWPARVQHSKSYRHPRGFENQNVLLIGAGVSSTDIAREIAPEAKHIYQISRGGAFDLPPFLLPPGTTRIVGEVAAFETTTTSSPDDATTITTLASSNTDNESNNTLIDPTIPIPGRVILKDGRALSDLHRIILCTGYHISLPFLRPYHADATPVSKADDSVLVTDGTQYHNLHHDIFYIPDPSLAFIGVPYFTATFTLFEFQAMVIAAVMSGRARLPSREEMRREYRRRLQRKGNGKRFHSLKEREVLYVDRLLEWVNRDGEGLEGVKPIQGHTKAWHEANEERLERVRGLFGGGSNDRDGGDDDDDDDDDDVI